jgi:hypothetical protein
MYIFSNEKLLQQLEFTHIYQPLGYDHVQAYSVVTYNVFWYNTYTFLRSSANSVICQ